MAEVTCVLVWVFDAVSLVYLVYLSLFVPVSFFFITILSLNLTPPPVSTLDQLLLFLLMLLE